MFIYLFVSYLLLWGAAVSLSRRRSLRHGTPGHDEIPRALGIMHPPSPLQIRLGSPLGKKLSSRKTGELLCLSGKNKPRIYSAAAYSSKHKWLLGGKGTGRKKGSAKFDLHAKPRYSLIRKRDWRSGSALRSHRRGHWFEPSITH